LKDGSDDPQLPKHLERLKREWESKSPEHKAARAFIYEKWPKPKDPAQLKAELEQARKAFDVCRSVGDRLTPQKLILAMKGHVDKLKKDEDALKIETDDGMRLAKVISDVADELKKFTEEVVEYLRAKKEDKSP